MRKWTYLVAALLMAGATTTFTGCIDNDEPEGITNLRGAKADLLRAKCAVEAAEAALRNAYAAEHNANAKWTEAQVENQKLLNESQKLKNEAEAAKTEADKAYWAGELARVEAELAENKLTWEKNRLAAETVLAQAKKDYEDAMKAIELSKNYLSAAELGQLNFVQGEYSYAFAKLYGGSYARWTGTADATTGKVTWTSVLGSVAKGAKDMLKDAYDQYKTDVETGKFEDISEIKLNARVADAKAKLATNMAELGVKQEALKALESSETLANWKKVKAQYKAKQDSLNDVVASKTIAANKIVIENADKAMAMQKALNTAADFKTKTFENGKIVQNADDNAVVEASEALASKLTVLSSDLTTAGGTYVSYANKKFTVALNTADLLKVTRDNGDNGTFTLVQGNLEKETTGTSATIPYEYWNENGVKLLDDAIVFNGGETTPYAKMNKAIDDVIKVLGGAKDNVPSIEKEQAEKELAAAKENLKTVNTAKETATTAWTNSITAWKKALAYSTEEADLKAVKTSAETYVKALTDANNIQDNTDKVKAQIKARQAFADAVVKYYNAVNGGPGLTSNTISLELNKATGSGKEWIAKTVLAWLSDANNKDGYLESLQSYFGITTPTAANLDAFWTKGTKETVTAGQEPTAKATAALASINTVDDVRNAWASASAALYGDVLGKYTVDGKTFGRETAPSAVEIKAQWEKDATTAGASGSVLSAEKRVKTAEEAVAQVDQFAAVIKGLEDVKGTIAKAKLEFMAEAETVIKAATDAQKACVDDIDSPVLALGIATDKALNDKIGNVIASVEGSIGEFDATIPNAALQETAKYIALIKNLKLEVSNLQKTTIPGSEDELIKAEAMLKAYKDGNMSAQHIIAWAQAKVDNAKASYDSAVEELTYWTETLKEVTTTLYGKASN